MRKLLTSLRGDTGDSFWLVFDKPESRDEAVRRFARRGWYTFTWTDVAGLALHAARVWYSSPPCAQNPTNGFPTHSDDSSCQRHRRVGI